MVVKTETKHNAYMRTMNTNEQLKNNIVAVRLHDHQLRTSINDNMTLSTCFLLKKRL